MFGISLIAVLAVMGGMIAYIGDKIGTKVGKRKLSVFGLRPKHTSIIVAVATGVFITASTLAILTVASRDVRTALFGMEKLRAELSGLSAEVTDKSQKLDASRELLRMKEEEYAGLTSHVAEAMEQLTKLQTELSSAIAQRDQTMAALARVQTDYDSARGDLAKAREDIAALEKTKKDLDSKINDLSVARDSLKGDVDRLTETTARLRTGIQYFREGKVLFRANEVLTTATVNTTVDGIQNELLTVILETNQKVLARMGKPNEQVEALWISQSDYQAALKNLQNADRSMVVRIVVDENTVLGEPVIAHLELYPDKRIFERGEEIYKATINMDGQADNVEQIVLSFLQQVNNTAIAKGVLPEDTLRGTVGSVGGADFFNTISQLKKMGGQVELVAIVSEDTSVAGPLQIRLVARRVNPW